MIRDGVFNPDATRANYFPGGAHRAAGTPAHVVMQPFTPAFQGRVQPGTPGLDEVQHGTMVATAPQAAQDALVVNAEIKSETSWSLVAGDVAGRVIDISSDSEDESSESDTCSDTSGQGDSTDIEMEAEADQPVHDDPARGLVRVWAKNVKTKIIHECRDEVDALFGDQDAFQAFMKDKLTRCGRVITGSYQMVMGPCDWTAKCRVCFKGRRAP